MERADNLTEPILESLIVVEYLAESLDDQYYDRAR